MERRVATFHWRTAADRLAERVIELERRLDEALGTLVDAYESGPDRPLAEEERRVLPVAMARQPFSSMGVWVALLHDEAAARRHLAATGSALDWGLRLVEDLAGR